jgi:hypothetical protein
VNRNFIEELQENESRVILHDGTELRIGRGFRQQLFETLLGSQKE